MRFITYRNRACLSLRDEYGRVPPFQLLIVAESGHGKGTATEAIAERWKRTTGGIVILLNDPKKEGEQTFVMYKPSERYHLKLLNRDKIKSNNYKAKLYHPYTHNLAKRGFLPDMNIYTLSIKDLTKDDWAILAESDSESETTKNIARVSEELGRNSGVYDFLKEFERLTEGKKDKGKLTYDPKNWLLKSGGGTSKSVKQVGGLLGPFKRDYFLRKDTCPYKLDWDKILLDPESYHIFLTNWIKDTKIRNFLVEVLLSQAVDHAQRLTNLGRLKKPILFLIPEILGVCPSESKGSSLYLAKALRKSLVRMRSQAGGMSCIADTQIWSQTASEVRSAFNNTFYGELNPEDSRVIVKANSYKSEHLELLNEVTKNKGSFIWYQHEDCIFSIFMPSHMHKEVGGQFNWISIYKKHFYDKMKRYDDIVNFMRKEFSSEESRIQEQIKIEQEEFEERERERKEKETEKKEIQTEKEIPKKDKTKEYLMKRAWVLHLEGKSDRYISRELGVAHKTAKGYYLTHKSKLETENKPEGDSPPGS